MSLPQLNAMLPVKMQMLQERKRAIRASGAWGGGWMEKADSQEAEGTWDKACFSSHFLPQGLRIRP